MSLLSASCTVWPFLFALLVLGNGGNFMIIGGTALVTETCLPHEKTRVQGFNDTREFATMAVSSSSAGVLVNAKRLGDRLIHRGYTRKIEIVEI